MHARWDSDHGHLVVNIEREEDLRLLRELFNTLETEKLASIGILDDDLRRHSAIEEFEFWRSLRDAHIDYLRWERNQRPEPMHELQESIAHWERLYSIAISERGSAVYRRDALNNEGCSSDSCALCEAFEGPESCVGCPVYKHTGRRGCMDTPYSAAANAIIDYKHEPSFGRRMDMVEKVEAELHFLRSLT